MKVFYRPEMAVDRPIMGSFSAQKPRVAVQDWLQRGLIQPADIHTFEPVTREDFALAHPTQMIQGILDLRQPNGYGTVDADLAATLPHTTGSLLGAARYALAHQERVCSPSGGFHHAHSTYASGYCTFNGLIITAIKLKQEGWVDRVGILDLDMHHGDGTDEMIRVHRLDWVQHITQGKHHYRREHLGRHAAHYFQWLQTALAAMSNVDLLICQLSADPHITDPLGGLLTTDELIKRDQMVFKHVVGKALVWNTAGGYQTDPRGTMEPVLRLHRNTVKACLSTEAGAGGYG